MRKSYRIKREDEFQHVFEHGQSVANRNFVIYHLHRDQPHFRVGISVGKKVGHTAVMRNQIKRYIRQSLLELKPQLDPQADFLVIARKPAKTLDMAGTKQNLIHALTLAGVLSQTTTPIADQNTSIKERDTRE
ncbi:ribonuclease P protein component [Lacticaseibacillus yichunensis]|uniref:Ribonuclease P protein component n=1 Tax=Lacticaseibacillus yichunensis TaxID=2486015 RepID=A0ABW4CPD2_9LACO|nr:ribonuclease P protein component [Lacticaseibacillus yichunensis]